jgi:hypothetical protein
MLDPKQPELANDAEARAMVLSLAQNPWIDQDGDKTALTLAEWKVALGYLHTFGADDQQRIQNLRRHFVIARPPTGAQIDLSRIPLELANEPEAMAAARFISADAQFDLDGYPGTITVQELAAAERGLSRLRAFLKTPGA